MQEAKGQNYMHGAAILTAGVIIMKILGFIYKVPIGNVLGDDGYSMFLSAYNVYNVFFTLATAGFPVALARMIATAHAQNRSYQVQRTFEVASATFAVIGVVFASVMVIFPNFMAGSILHNPEAALSIRAMAPSVLLVCLLSAHRGYCEGHGNMNPTTIGQVMEVLVKVVVGLGLAMLLLKLGKGKAWASAGAISGATIGSLAALIYMILYKKKHYSFHAETAEDEPDPKSVILKNFLSIGIPVAAGSCVMALLNLVDSGLCMQRLQGAAGFSLQKSQELYGVYGKAQTIFNLPAAIITPLTISIVPAISAAMARGKTEEAGKITEDSMRIAAVLALPMGVGLAVMAEPIMNVLYPGSNAAGPALLSLMGIASFFVCMVLLENAILQASWYEKIPMITMVIGSLAKIAVNWVLIANPKINIYGAPIGTLCGYFVMFMLNFLVMCRVLDRKPSASRILLKPLLCSAAMGAGAFLSYRALNAILGSGRILLAAAMAGAILVAVIIYLVLVIVTGCITKEDMSLIPKGEKIARKLHMK